MGTSPTSRLVALDSSNCSVMVEMGRQSDVDHIDFTIVEKRFNIIVTIIDSKVLGGGGERGWISPKCMRKWLWAL
jgi:hypothetical protein